MVDHHQEWVVRHVVEAEEVEAVVFVVEEEVILAEEIVAAEVVASVAEEAWIEEAEEDLGTSYNYSFFSPQN